MHHYVVGFLFTQKMIGNIPYKKYVLLIRKNRPVWQKGWLNGVGGGINPGETPAAAMDREFTEEAGLAQLPWSPVAIVSGETFVVHYFMCEVKPELFYQAAAKTDEQLERLCVDDMWFEHIVRDLYIIVPLALNTDIVKPVMISTSLKVPV